MIIQKNLFKAIAMKENQTVSLLFRKAKLEIQHNCSPEESMGYDKDGSMM